MNKDLLALLKEKANVSVQLVYKVMHVVMRLRSDLHPALGFLITRVASPTEEDWTKFKRTLLFSN